MRPVLTPAEMAEADRRTIAAGTPVDVLMDRAGRAVAWAVRRRLGGTYGERAVVVCGKGNNGGDGVVAARVLRGWGVGVDVFELSKGIDHVAFERSVDRSGVVIDAMFGTGFRGELDGDARYVADTITARDVQVVAVDVPSGAAVRADETVCFAALKPTLLFEPGRAHAGLVTVVDIGIDIGEPGLGVVDEDDVASWLGPPSPETNKWKTGLLVVGGSGGMTGAPMMVSHAAMRAGAGIVWCGVPGDAAAAAASGTEVITKAMPATADGALAGIDDGVRDALARFQAAAIGPGLGTAPDTVAAVHELIRTIPVPMVLDADGLNAFAGTADALRDRGAPTVLTPHEAEYARLMGEDVGDDRVEAACRLAETTGCVALLKGPGTVIATPDGRAAVNIVDGPWLGTAGSGDVLTGIIGALLARGLEPFEAAAAGAFLHGRAADVAGHTGLVAGDLIPALPRTLATILDQEP